MRYIMSRRTWRKSNVTNDLDLNSLHFIQNGWIGEDGNWSNIDNGGQYVSKWFNIDTQEVYYTRSSSSSWQILMMYNGKKVAAGSWTSNENFSNMASPGHANFRNATLVNTGAENRASFGDGVGVYQAFFNQNNITKVAFVDGSSFSSNPSDHDNFLIYDLVESTSSETIYNILDRLDRYQQNAALFHNNDTVWGDSSVVNHTAGINGYSGLLTSSGGMDFVTTNSGMPSGIRQIPDKFCIMGINREADNDIQSLCAFWGDLNSGKGDAWRNFDPQQTFWSYWGADFHSSSQTQRIGASLQTTPGVASGALWEGNVYLMAFSE